MEENPIVNHGLVSVHYTAKERKKRRLKTVRCWREILACCRRRDSFDSFSLQAKIKKAFSFAE